MDYEQLADAIAFCGNSLLAPMTQTAAVGCDPAFWDAFPTFGCPEVVAAACACATWACGATAASVDDGSEQLDVVTRCAVEYTRLFVGPPRPAAAPWETAYRAAAQSGRDDVVGFGQATFEMRELLRQEGLELSNENRQYEDHMGIELLLLSEMLRRACAGEGDDAQEALARARRFTADHPAAWIEALRAKVDDAVPGGYFANLLRLAAALLAAVDR